MMLDRPDVARSFRRSRTRVKVWRALRRLGAGYASELARSAGTDARTVRWVMKGEPPRYRRELALERLSLARSFRTANGLFYVVTEKGMREDWLRRSRTGR